MIEHPDAVPRPEQRTLHREGSAWMLAHVLAGGAYVQLRVRCTRVLPAGARSRPELAAPGREGLVGVGSFATSLARALARVGSPADSLEVDATFWEADVTSGPNVGTVSVLLSAQGPGLDGAALEGLALHVFEERRAQGLWPSDIQVMLSVGVAPDPRPAGGGRGSENADTPASPATTVYPHGRGHFAPLTARVVAPARIVVLVLALVMLVLPQADHRGSGAGVPQLATPAAERASKRAPRTLLDVSTESASHLAWPNDPRSVAWVAADGYHLFARQPHQFVAIATRTDQAPSDVLVTAAFHKLGGPPGGGYGIVVRDQEPELRDGLNQSGRYYVLAVGDRGDVGIWRRAGDQWIDLVNWVRSPAVHPDNAANTLAARAIGDQLSLSVNGTPVAAARDATLVDGNVGVFLGGDQNHAVLTQLTIQSIE